MNIPDEAVRAATNAIFDASDGINASLIYRHEAETFARAALEAAAPIITEHLVKEASVSLKPSRCRAQHEIRVEFPGPKYTEGY